MWIEIANLRKNGFIPRTIIDIGAHRGEWSKQVSRIFPKARLYLIEADPTQNSTLTEVARELEGSTAYIQALVGADSATDVPYFLMGSGSSVLSEKTTFPRTRIALPMTTVDALLGAVDLTPAIFMKLDVQGYELEVLRGSSNTLRHVEVVLMEVSLLEYNEGAPLLAEVVLFMKSIRFVAFDICGGLRRQSDGALFQMDVIFVREDSFLRSPKKFWNTEP